MSLQTGGGSHGDSSNSTCQECDYRGGDPIRLAELPFIEVRIPIVLSRRRSQCALSPKKGRHWSTPVPKNGTGNPQEVEHRATEERQNNQPIPSASPHCPLVRLLIGRSLWFLASVPRERSIE